MKDQAEKLREMIKKSTTSKNDISLKKRTNTTRVMAITSGKGGVGKTNFTINLAISLSKLGYKVVIFDADIGLANIDIILGVTPKHTIAEVLDGNKNITDIMTEGPNGLKIIAGGSGIAQLAQLNNEQLDILTAQLAKLEEYADFILIDTGAGLSDTVLNFVNVANEVILVTTPEPTSLTDGYAMIKTITSKGKHQKINLLVNRVEDNKEAKEVFNKLNMVTNRFLKINMENLGYLYKSDLVEDSVKNQKPFIILYPNSNISRKINGIALTIAGDENSKSNEIGFGKFISKFKTIFSKGGYF